MHVLKGWRPLIGMVCCLTLLGCGGAAGGTRAAGAQTDQEGPGRALRLDLAERTLVHPIEEAGIARPAQQKFVQVEIAAIVNPRLVPIMFEVRYRPETGADELLGTFSPFPPDNPGTFIVATRGRLRAGGAILLALVPLEEVGPEDQVQVELTAISLREE